jgi:hypothetical protein
MKPTRGRPLKKRGELKDVDLRIPVTAAQKQEVVAAAGLAGEDMAAWARAILLREARAQAASAENDRQE